MNCYSKTETDGPYALKSSKTQTKYGSSVGKYYNCISKLSKVYKESFRKLHRNNKKHKVYMWSWTKLLKKTYFRYAHTYEYVIFNLFFLMSQQFKQKLKMIL